MKIMKNDSIDWREAKAEKKTIGIVLRVANKLHVSQMAIFDEVNTAAA